MANSASGKTGEFKVWIAVKRLDLHDDRLTALQEVSIPRGADTQLVKEIISRSFGLDLDHTILKIRNIRGCLVPLNCLLQVNSKRMPYVLEVVSVFQHGMTWTLQHVNKNVENAALANWLDVRHFAPKPRIIAKNINKSMKTRLQSVIRRIEQLEELVPQIKLRHQEKIIQEIDFLSQKLVFLNKRMQMVDSHCWRGMFTRPPLW